MKTKDIQDIHESLVNGQRKQMVEQIDAYGVCDFWPDYKEYLTTGWSSDKRILEYLTDATNSYFKIKGR